MILPTFHGLNDFSHELRTSMYENITRFLTRPRTKTFVENLYPENIKINIFMVENKRFGWKSLEKRTRYEKKKEKNEKKRKKWKKKKKMKKKKKKMKKKKKKWKKKEKNEKKKEKNEKKKEKNEKKNEKKDEKKKRCRIRIWFGAGRNLDYFSRMKF